MSSCPVLLQVGKSYASAKEAIIMTGSFLLEQLRRMDNAAGGKATFAFGGTAFVSALATEVSPAKRSTQHHLTRDLQHPASHVACSP